MKARSGLLVALASVALGGCATAEKPKVADAEKALVNDEKEIGQLQGEEFNKLRSLTQANRRLAGELQDEILRGQITVSTANQRLTLSVVEEVLFDSGRAELKGPGKLVLDKVATAIRGLKNHEIMIEGHTDNVPIAAAWRTRYPSNWELSTARATAVVRYLMKEGADPKELGAAGYGEYRPVAANDSEEGRQKNRRIDVVLTPMFQEKEQALSSIQEP